MNKKLIMAPSTLAITMVLCSFNQCFADNASTIKNKQTLILTIAKNHPGLEHKSRFKQDTFADKNKHQQTDTVTKQLKNAHKKIKRLTSLKYGKRQKVKASIGKSSYTLQYTHTL